MTTEVASLKAVFTADNSNLIKGTNEAANAISGFGSTVSGKLKNAGADISNFGKKWTIATAPITAALGISVKKFASFESAMANANSITGATGDEAKRLNDEILALGGSVRQGPQAVAEAYYQIVSGVGDASQHMSILNTSLAVSEAGAANLTGTVGALIGSMNAYGASADDAASYGDIMTATVQSGVLTMDELASALPNITSQAASMGIGFADVNAGLARMTQVGVSASQASTQMRQAMVSILTPSKNLAAAIDELGYANGQALIDAEGFQGALQLLSDTSVAADVGINGMFTSVEAANAAMILGTQAAAEFTEKFKGMNAELEASSGKSLSFDLMGDGFEPDMGGFDGATEAAQAIQSDTLTSEIELMNASLSEMSIMVGETLAPALRDLAEGITDIVGDIQEWATANPEAFNSLVKLAAVVAIAGPVMTIFGGIVTAVGVAIGALTSPILLVVGAGVLLGGTIFTLSTKMGGLQEAITNLTSGDLPELSEQLGSIEQDVNEGLLTPFDAIIQKIPELGPIFESGFSGLGEFITGPANLLKGMVDAVDKLKTNPQDLPGAFSSAFGGLIDYINVPLDGLKGIADFINKIISHLAGVPDAFGNAFSGIADKLAPALGALDQLAQKANGLLNLVGLGGGGGGGGFSFEGPATPGGLINKAQDFVSPSNNAMGGPIAAGELSWVGEQGPELFMPGRSGTIIPNHELMGAGGGGRTIVLQNPIFNGVTDVATFFDELEREAGRRS